MERFETHARRLSAPLGGIATGIASGLDHVRWWLEWQTRSRPATGARPLEEEPEALERAAA
jgi:hypothetical protein